MQLRKLCALENDISMVSSHTSTSICVSQSSPGHHSSARVEASSPEMHQLVFVLYDPDYRVVVVHATHAMP